MKQAVKQRLHSFCKDLICRSTFAISRDIYTQQYSSCWCYVYFTNEAFYFVVLFYTRTCSNKDWRYGSTCIPICGGQGVTVVIVVAFCIPAPIWTDYS